MTRTGERRHYEETEQASVSDTESGTIESNPISGTHGASSGTNTEHMLAMTRPHVPSVASPSKQYDAP